MCSSVLYAWPLFWLFCVDVLDAAFPDLRRRVELVLLSLFCLVAPRRGSTCLYERHIKEADLQAQYPV
jgi:hypothetical protein